jgi:predicted GNAT family acetyltransferase
VATSNIATSDSMSEGQIKISHTSTVIYINLDGGKKAYLKYEVVDNIMKLIETYTPPEYRGRGLAAMLVEYAIDLAKKNNWKIEPVCSYTIYYFMKHHDKRDILVDTYKNLSEEEWRALFERARSLEAMKSG